jgi:hypothetical protein
MGFCYGNMEGEESTVYRVGLRSSWWMWIWMLKRCFRYYLDMGLGCDDVHPVLIPSLFLV